MITREDLKVGDLYTMGSLTAEIKYIGEDHVVYLINGRTEGVLTIEMFNESYTPKVKEKEQIKLVGYINRASGEFKEYEPGIYMLKDQWKRVSERTIEVENDYT